MLEIDIAEGNFSFMLFCSKSNFLRSNHFFYSLIFEDTNNGTILADTGER